MKYPRLSRGDSQELEGTSYVRHFEINDESVSDLKEEKIDIFPYN